MEQMVGAKWKANIAAKKYRPGGKMIDDIEENNTVTVVIEGVGNSSWLVAVLVMMCMFHSHI